MKNTIFFILLSLIFGASVEGKSTTAKLSYKSFSRIPVLAEGRIKPLDTFARTNLLLVHEKSSLKKMSAIEWLAELLLDPPTAYQRKIFKIRNSDVIKALSLESDPSHNYSFIEVSSAVNREQNLVSEIARIPQKDQTPTQRQIYQLHHKVIKIFNISRSFSLLAPQFKIPNEDFANILELPFGQSLNYLQLQKRKNQFTELAAKIINNKKGNFSEDEQKLLDMGRKLEYIAADSMSSELRIVPPQFYKTPDREWLSPWQTIQHGQGSPLTVKFFKHWSDLHSAYNSKDLDAWDELSSRIYEGSLSLSSGISDSKKIEWEVKYNNWDFFTKSLSFYILAFLFLSVSWLFWGKKLALAGLGSLFIGSILHLIGLVLRCYIMDRPPVSTLYESIIFVSYISVISSIILEFKHRNNLGTFIGATLGALLLFISFSYAKDGDSMGMLAAVLDTNFWLATHVVTITIGYGCCFVAALLGHIYLFQRIIRDKTGFKRQFNSKMIVKNMLGASLFALFFTVLGTILGGIWADQSWGRFWGWDPKENGAMLICMWLLWAIHGRLTTYFNDLGFAVVTALTGVVVVLAWFGVNLLNVGLHSYGFTDNIATNIAVFSAIETVFCLGTLGILKFQSVQKAEENKALAYD